MDPLWVQPGTTVEVRGRFLPAAGQILFYGGRGQADNAAAALSPVSSGRVRASVPSGAASGPIAVLPVSGGRSRRWGSLVVDDGLGAPPVPSQQGSQPAIGTAVSKLREIFYGGLRNAVFSFQVASAGPVDVTVNLVRLADRAVVTSWTQPQVSPGEVRRVIWNGRTAGKQLPEGYYAFQAAMPGGVVASAAPAAANGGGASGEDAFALYGHIFPVREKHDFGGAGAEFGSVRRGHSHQGQDVFARCGAPLVAARAGKVVFKGFHQQAGYYLVVRGTGTAQDYVYMHLREPALVEHGQRVYTGQPIGAVGDSGNAHGCHLHFELWSAPGWYKGGRPFDPLPELQHWDKVS